MSGFAGVVGPSGAPVDPDVVSNLAGAIAYCGPDRQGSWRGDGAALAHTLLRTTGEDAGDRQPVTFDGAVWLVADARVDGRKSLLAALRDAGREVSAGAPDSELILHAYHAWGEACVERLIGDFAFAVWDAGRRRLFCARDQFGVTPFYYAAAGEWLVFGDAVEAVLSHPGVDPALNRSTIGDYLLFGYSKEPEAGFYRNVRRLPAAHCLTVENGQTRVRRYWTPPEPDPRPGRESEADTVERFRAILAEAVSDRLRWPKVASTLSGGMDSTLVTGFALRHAPAGCRIDAYSSGCNWLLPDQERYWAHVCATHLGVAFHAVSVEDHLLTPSDGEYWRRLPEPRFWVRRLPNEALFRAVADSGARVLLMGMGGDALVAGGWGAWGEMMARGDLAALTPHLWRYYRYFGRRPPVRGVWTRYRTTVRTPPLVAPLDPGFAAEQGLEERWQAATAAWLSLDDRKSMIDNSFWSEMFSGFDPESMRLPLKVRQPFFDVRLYEEAMRLPPTPWQFEKTIMRRAGADMLPDAILTRPKTPYSGNVYFEAARLGYEPWLAGLGQAGELEGFVDLPRLGGYAGDVEALGRNRYHQGVMYPAGLAAWLRTRRY